MPLRMFRQFMLFWAVCFLGVGLFFVFYPNPTIRLVNFIAPFGPFSGFILPHFDYFWLALAGSMMMTVSYLCYEVYKNPFNTTALRGVLIAKGASSLFFVASALRAHQTIYLLGTTIDGLIFLAILLAYQNLKKDRFPPSRE